MVRGCFGFNDERESMTGFEPTKDDVSRKDDTRAGKPLPAAARRALAEAAERRKQYERREAAMPREFGGRGGKDPGRYGDWEVRGIASDF
jgi:hypothetical protein